MPDTQTTVDHKPVAAVPPGAPAAQGAPANAAKGPPKRVLIVVGLIAAAAAVREVRMAEGRDQKDEKNDA
jgi:membrane fusion protein (multidrug efflux system)